MKKNREKIMRISLNRKKKKSSKKRLNLQACYLKKMHQKQKFIPFLDIMIMRICGKNTISNDLYLDFNENYRELLGNLKDSTNVQAKKKFK